MMHCQAVNEPLDAETASSEVQRIMEFGIVRRTWRYRFETAEMAVAVLFKSENELKIVNS